MNPHPSDAGASGQHPPTHLLLLTRPMPRYVVAVLAVGLACLLRLALTDAAGVRLPYATFFPAVMVAAMLGGLGPGLLATGLSALLVEIWFSPSAGSSFPDAVDHIGMAIFLSVGVFMSVIADLYQRVSAKVTGLERERGDHLQNLIAARTLDLEAANREVRAKTTEHVSDEAALGESEARLRLFVDHAPVAMAMLDTHMCYIANSHRWLVEHGLPDQCLHGRCHYEVFPEVPARWKDIHRRCLAGAIERAEEDLCERPDGSTHWLRWEIRPWFAEAGVVGGIVIFTEDISERKRAELELRESRERFELVARGTVDGIWDWNVVTGCEYFSERWCELLGYTTAELTPHTDTWVGLLHPEDKDRVLAAIQAHLTQGTLFDLDYRLRKKDGTYLWVRASGQARWDETGKPLRMAGSITDITAYKKAAEDKMRFAAQLEQTQKLESLGVLAGGIAHDFNNLLTSVLGYCDLAQLRLAPGSPIRPLLDQAMKGARRAADLTKQLLAYSGKGRFVVEPLNLSTLVEEMTRLLQLSISKKAVLTFDLMEDLPMIHADATQMRQILMNLIINASEAIGESNGIITVSTSLRYCDRAALAQNDIDDHLSEGMYVQLVVADNGCGMSPEIQAKIFDPFFTTKFTGRGLGLSAVLGIVRGHQGALRCSSEPGKGTTFTLLFPATTRSARLMTQPPHAGKWKGSGTVLVVDDEDSIRTLATAMLTKLGFAVVSAADGQEALELFRQDPAKFTLVLLDLTMPHLDGPETFAALRRIRADVKVILSSGYDEQTAISTFAGKGLAGFLKKPYHYEELQTITRTVLGDTSTPTSKKLILGSEAPTPPRSAVVS